MANLNLKKLLTKLVNRVQPIGTVVNGTNSTTVSVPSSVKTNASEMSLSPGVWVVTYQSALSLSQGKQYQATISTTIDISAEQLFLGISGLHRLNLTAILNINTTTTVYGTVYHNNGSSVTVNTNSLNAVRII